MDKQEQYLAHFRTMSRAEQRRDLAIILAYLLESIQKKAQPTAKHSPIIEEVSLENVPHADQARIDATASELIADLNI